MGPAPRSPTERVSRSPILAASESYWHWLGAALTDWADQIFGGHRRRRSWFVFGGCFTWIFVIFFYLLAVFAIAGIMLALVAALTVFGCLLSVAGGFDQVRFEIMARRRARATD